MPMNRDGRNRMDGFLHAAADMDSARPDVQFYREHYRSVFGGSGTSSAPSGDMVPGIVALGLIFGLIYAVGFVAENWQTVLAIGGVVFVIAIIWAIASYFLHNFFSRAGTLLLLLWISSAIWFAAYVAIHPALAAYLPAKLPPPGVLLAVPILYAPFVIGLCLTPWARRDRSIWQSALLANLVLGGVPAVLAAVAMMN